MKRTSLLASACWLTLVLGIAAAPAPARAADNKKPATPVEKDAATNAPEAVFDMKASSVRDPFFPLSTRTAVVATVTNAPAQISAKSFRLMGKSGTDDAPLVIINDHSFAPGEKAWIVPLNSFSKVGVTVLQIKEYSAIIQVDGFSAPLEISLPDSFH